MCVQLNLCAIGFRNLTWDGSSSHNDLQQVELLAAPVAPTALSLVSSPTGPKLVAASSTVSRLPAPGFWLTGQQTVDFEAAPLSVWWRGFFEAEWSFGGQFVKWSGSSRSDPNFSSFQGRPLLRLQHQLQVWTAFFLYQFHSQLVCSTAATSVACGILYLRGRLQLQWPCYFCLQSPFLSISGSFLRPGSFGNRTAISVIGGDSVCLKGRIRMEGGGFGGGYSSTGAIEKFPRRFADL